jgi:hypothetical protein
MSTKPSSLKTTKRQAVTGQPVAALGTRFVLIRVGSKAGGRKSEVQPGDTASVLVAKAGQALKKPGIPKQAVFGRGDGSGIYAYSVYPADPTKIVREAADGSRTVGRLVNGRFQALKSKAA